MGGGDRRNMSGGDQFGGRAGRSRSNSFSGYGQQYGGGGSSYGRISPSFGGQPPSPYGGGAPAYMGSSSGDPYAGDTFMYPARHRSRSRSHSRSGHRHRSHSPAIIMPPSVSAGYTSPMAIPGTMVQPTYSTGGSYGAYGTTGMSPYQQASPMQMYAGGGSSGMGYASSVPQVQALPAGTMVIPSRRRHRHSTSSSGHHHHSSSHRPRSSDEYQQAYSMGVPTYAGSSGYRY